MLGGLRVVHTPGHTPGSVCLYAERLRLLFTGDVLQVIRGRLAYASWFFSHDHAGARASVERLAALEVDTIALSTTHRGPTTPTVRSASSPRRRCPDRSSSEVAQAEDAHMETVNGLIQRSVEGFDLGRR